MVPLHRHPIVSSPVSPSHVGPFSRLLIILHRFQCFLAAPSLAYLLDHVVQGTSILPGAGMLEMCTARWAISTLIMLLLTCLRRRQARSSH